MADYVVASVKEWNRPLFDSFTKNSPERWRYVSRMEDLNMALEEVEPRFIFFLHWNDKVPEEIFKNYDSVCFHMTDVPYGRGGSPLQNLISRSITETKISALKMVEEMDAGPVYMKEKLKLVGRAEDIYKSAGKICFGMIERIIQKEPIPLPQEGTPVVFKRRVPGQSELPLSGDLATLYDHIRMLDAPTYPLAYIDYGEFRFEFSHAELLGEEMTTRVKISKINK